MHSSAGPLNIEEDPAVVAQRQFQAELRRREENVQSGRPPVRMMQSTYNMGAIHHYKPNFDLPPELKRCVDILIKIMNHEHAYWFNDPVDWMTLNIPQYPEKVPHPMDLGTVKGKLEHDLYQTVEDFDRDVKLVWSNCKNFNHKNTVVYQAADALERMYDNDMKWYFQGKQRREGGAEPEVIEGRIGKIKLKVRLKSSPKNSDSPGTPFSGTPSNSVSLSAPYPSFSPTHKPRRSRTTQNQQTKPKRAKYAQNNEKFPSEEVLRVRQDLDKLPGQVLQQVLNEFYKDSVFLQNNPNPNAGSVQIDLKSLNSHTLWACRQLLDKYFARTAPKSRKSLPARALPAKPVNGSNIVLHRRNGAQSHVSGGTQSRVGVGTQSRVGTPRQWMDDQRGGGPPGKERKRPRVDDPNLVEARRKKSQKEANEEVMNLLYGDNDLSPSNGSSAPRSNGYNASPKTFSPSASPRAPTNGGAPIKLNTGNIQLRQHGDDSDSSDSDSESESEMSDSGSDSDDDRDIAHFM